MNIELWFKRLSKFYYSNVIYINLWSYRILLKTLLELFWYLIAKFIFKNALLMRLRIYYISCRGVRPLPQRGVLDWTLYCIWWWGSQSGEWSTPSLPLLPGPLWPGMVIPVVFPSICQIDSFENYSFAKGPCTKNNNLN